MSSGESGGNELEERSEGREPEGGGPFSPAGKWGVVEGTGKQAGEAGVELRDFWKSRAVQSREQPVVSESQDFPVWVRAPQQCFSGRPSRKWLEQPQRWREGAGPATEGAKASQS